MAVLIVVSAASANCGVEIINAHRVADLTALLVTFFRLVAPPLVPADLKVKGALVT